MFALVTVDGHKLAKKIRIVFKMKQRNGPIHVTHRQPAPKRNCQCLYDSQHIHLLVHTMRNVYSCNGYETKSNCSTEMETEKK